METKHTRDTITKGFVLGLKGLIQNADVISSRIINFFIVIGIIVSVILINLNIDFYKYINEIVNLTIQLVPGLLGFTIAGYSLLTGFIPKDLMERISEPQKKTHVSLYQNITASLAFNIFLHAVILVIAYIFHVFINLQDNNPNLVLPNEKLVKYINYGGAIVVTLCVSCALGVIIQIIVSSFNLTQLYHYNINKEKLDIKEKRIDDQNNPPSTIITEI